MVTPDAILGHYDVHRLETGDWSTFHYFQNSTDDRRKQKRTPEGDQTHVLRSVMGALGRVPYRESQRAERHKKMFRKGLEREWRTCCQIQSFQDFSRAFPVDGFLSQSVEPVNLIRDSLNTARIREKTSSSRGQKTLDIGQVIYSS